VIQSSTSLGVSQAHAAAVEAAQKAAGIQATAKKTVLAAPASAVKSGQPTGLGTIPDGGGFAKVKAVSPQNQCQTASITSGAVTASAQQQITSNFALTTSAQSVASVTVAAPQGYVRVSMTALLLNYDSSQVVHYVSVTLYKGTSSGTQMLLHPLIAVPIAGSVGQPHGVPDAMVVLDYSPSSSQQYTVVMSADANSSVEVNPVCLIAEVVKV
jgi:hypothetical protein